ncbi:phage portal protein [Ruegeria marisrubri]|uniref:phage portal protein n=1 Tax=Ruegeria marisrubri TaxID=1685379 RepID=UPI001CD6961F|nr:phage portal protein [Ruegeria marisrubri]MCA0905143.1 phage portal protein [Ruegeria marisrubri]
MRGQNTSSAVMQQRKEARDALDDFPTPPWATRAVCEWLAKRHDLNSLVVREPCANRGYMVAPLSEYFASVEASDLHDYDRNQRVLVARSRHQAANNDYMKAFLRLCDQNIVGHRGVVLQAQARDNDGSLDRAANEALESWWRQWCRAENCDVTGRRSFRVMCKSAVRSAAKDGEFMFREIRGRAAPMGYALQILDPQRCPIDYSIERLPQGRFVRQGIEFSREGRPLAYYFMTGDPARNAYTFNGSNLERVPAGEIIHGFLEDIVGQRRGLPWAATTLWRMNQLNEFEKAAVVNARMGASVGGFLEWEEGYGPEPDDDDLDAHEEFYIEAEGGVFQELPEGLKHKAFDSRYPTGEFTPFHKAMLRGTAAGMGVSYVSLANDLEGVNFSSIRQGVLDEREHWMDLQEWLIETLIERAYQNALQPALLLGLVKDGPVRLKPERIAKYRKVFWQGRRWAWVDPQKDINAEVTAKDNLLTAPSEIIRKQGRDPETVWRTLAGDIKSMQDAGIPEKFIMATMGQALGASAPATQEETPNEGNE